MPLSFNVTNSLSIQEGDVYSIFPAFWGYEQKEQIRQLNLKKEAVYATIKELEFDLTMGKLSREDYETLKNQYSREAVGYINEITELESKKDKTNGKSSLFCTKCGTESSNSNKFCTNCGVSLTVM